jgi:hypothetical protein
MRQTFNSPSVIRTKPILHRFSSIGVRTSSSRAQPTSRPDESQHLAHECTYYETLGMTQYNSFYQKRFQAYLTAVFSDLSLRSPQVAQQYTIDKNVFLAYAQLPGIIGERLIAVAGHNRPTKGLTGANFTNLMFGLFGSSQQQKLQLIFQLIDSDTDGQISAPDVKLILSHALLN